MKYLVLVSLGIALLAFAGIVVRDLQYPREWDQIHIGQTRADVENLIGPGGGEWPGWSGVYWEDVDGSLIRNELYISFGSSNTVELLTIKRLTKRPEHSLWFARYEASRVQH